MASRVWNNINLPGTTHSKEEEPADETRIVAAEWVLRLKGIHQSM